jgi:hypothetical protein
MFDQALPHDAFLQVHAGFERPTDHSIESNSAYLRSGLGKMFKQHQWGRTWTPMLEVLAVKDLVPDAKIHWDIVPQMQVSLSVFQHVLLDVGVDIPVTERDTRPRTVMVYLIWDWFDGPFFQLWRAH